VRRLPHLIFALPLLMSCGSDTVAPPASLIGRFDLFWETFDKQYSYFAYKAINWDSLRDVYRPAAEAAKSQDELVEILKQMVAPLRDVHVNFRTPAGVVQSSFQPATPTNWNSEVWFQATKSCSFHELKPNLGACTMGGGIGYVAIGSWDPSAFTTSFLDVVIDQFRGAPGIILDVRPNGGGDDALALALAGRFARRRTTIGYVRFRDGPQHDDFGEEIAREVRPRGAFQFTQPVVVLAGRGVYSSSETFIAAMRELPNVVILGDTTGGGSGNPRTFALGDGWTCSVSRWIEWTADRRVIEWNGIPPDVFVAWDSAAVNHHSDPVLEAARALLWATTSSALQRPR
jgi:peptidase S41-like protein/tricorn protease-like protein